MDVLLTTKLNTTKLIFPCNTVILNIFFNLNAVSLSTTFKCLCTKTIMKDHNITISVIKKEIKRTSLQHIVNSGVFSCNMTTKHVTCNMITKI